MTNRPRESGFGEALDLLITIAGEPALEPAFLTRIRLRARRLVLWLRRQWAGDAAAAGGLAISHGEVDRILADADERVRAERTFYEADATARELMAPILAADLAIAGDDALGRLRRDFALGDAEADLLTLAVAVEADPAFRRVFAYIHDDAAMGLPT